MCVFACCALLQGTLGCCRPGSSETTGSADVTAAASPKTTDGTPKSSATAAPQPFTCTKFAALDKAAKPRPPILTTVKGARVPAGGTTGAKKPELFSIDYFTPETPKTEVACTIRKQLEADGWTIESMSGSSPVTILARKGTAAIQVMVGPGDGDAITKAILSAR